MCPLRVSGRLDTPSAIEDFDYPEYLAVHGIYSLIRYPRIEPLLSGPRNLFWTAIYTIKDRARTTIARLLPEPD
jgi:hypothetical protein